MRYSLQQQSVERSSGAQCGYSGEACGPGFGVATLCRALRPSRMLGFYCVLTALLGGCGKESSNSQPPLAHKHEHIPPHHGTPVVLGNEEYHVELVLDAPAGKRQELVMDG